MVYCVGYKLSERMGLFFKRKQLILVYMTNPIPGRPVVTSYSEHLFYTNRNAYCQMDISVGTEMFKTLCSPHEAPIFWQREVTARWVPNTLTPELQRKTKQMC